MQKLQSVPVCSVAVAYDCPWDHHTYILRFNQVLHIPSLESNLLCVDQMREHGITVNDVPLQRLAPHLRRHDSHSITNDASDLHIPLLFEKPVSYFECRVPNDEELADHINRTHVTMTGTIP